MTSGIEFYKKHLKEIDDKMDLIDDSLLETYGRGELLYRISEQRQEIRKLSLENTKLKYLKDELRNELNNYGVRSVGTSMSGKDYNYPKEIPVIEVLNILDKLEVLLDE